MGNTFFPSLSCQAHQDFRFRDKHADLSLPTSRSTFTEPTYARESMLEIPDKSTLLRQKKNARSTNIYEYTKRISRYETGKPNTFPIFQRKSSPRTAPSGSLPTPGDWRTSSSTIARWRRCNSPSTSPRVRAPTRGTGHSATPRPGRPTPRSPSSLWTCAVWRTSRPTGSSHRRSSPRGRSHFILTHKKMVCLKDIGSQICIGVFWYRLGLPMGIGGIYGYCNYCNNC